MKTTSHPIRLALAAALIGAAILSAPQAKAGHDRAYVAAGALIGGVLGYLASDRDDHRGRVTVRARHHRPRPVVVQYPRPVVVHRPRPVVVHRPRPVVVQYPRPVVVVRPGHGTCPSYQRPYYRHSRHDRRPVYQYRQKRHGNPHYYGKGHGKSGGYSNDSHGKGGGYTNDSHGKGHGNSKGKGNHR